MSKCKTIARYEKPVCDRCGEEDNPNKIGMKVEICHLCSWADQIRIDALTAALEGWMKEYYLRSPGEHYRMHREYQLFQVCKGLGLKYE